MKKILIAVSALAFAFALSAKPLKLDVPRAQIIGTPVPVKLPNLEPKTPNPVPDVPDDVKNVAKGKKVTSSDDFRSLENSSSSPTAIRARRKDAMSS